MGEAKQKAPPSQSTSQGIDGLNLVEFPLSVLSTKVPDGVKTLEFQETKLVDGSPLHQKLTITGSDKYGLPTITHHKLLVALLQIFNARGDFKNPRIEFTRYELLKKIGWPDDAHYYRVARDALKIWKGVNLYYENAWWVDGKFKTKGFSLIDDFEIFEKRRGTGRRTKIEQTDEPSYIVLGSVVAEEFRKQRTKGLDYEFYLRLKYPVSKQLYRYLDKWFWYSPVFRHPDVLKFAREKIGLSRNYDAANLKRLLDKGIRELTTAGYLRQDAYAMRYTSAGGLEFKRNAARVRKENSEIQSPLELKLQKRGVTKGRNKPTCAGSLVETYSESLIAEKVAVHDWLLTAGDPRIKKNPAGYLVDSIRFGWPPPSGFKSTSERQAEADARHAAAKRMSERKQRQDLAALKKEQEEDARFEEFIAAGNAAGTIEHFEADALGFGFFKQYYDDCLAKGDLDVAEKWKHRAMRAYWKRRTAT